MIFRWLRERREAKDIKVGEKLLAELDLPEGLRTALEGEPSRYVHQVGYDYIVLLEPTEQADLQDWLEGGGTVRDWYKQHWS